jgi:hypothetical protein
MMPTLPLEAFPIGQLHPTEIGGRPIRIHDAFPFTHPFNLSGHPAATVRTRGEIRVNEDAAQTIRVDVDGIRGAGHPHGPQARQHGCMQRFPLERIHVLTYSFLVR